MTRTAPLLQRNAEFAATGGHRRTPLMPRLGLFVVTCLDPRVEPGGFLGLEPGDAVVVRNAGGRVTDDVLQDLALITALAARQVASGPLFEVAVVHHTDCGTAVLTDPRFRDDLAARTGVPESALAARAVVRPEETVRTDVDLVRTSSWLSARTTVSGHVLDLDTGLVRTVAPARPVEPGDATSGAPAVRAVRA